MEQELIFFKSRLSIKQAIEKIVAHAIYGEHTVDPRPINSDEVARVLLANGLNPDRVAQECRDYKSVVPLFENLVSGGSWSVFGGEGGSVQLLDRDTGEPISPAISSGDLVMTGYLAQFGAACEARDRAVKKCAFTEVQTTAVLGVASIESYMASLVRAWNRRNPGDELMDSKDSKVSFDTKIDEWIPKISGGGKLDKSDQRWRDFQLLRGIRNDVAIHAKQDAFATSPREIADSLNAFRFGIARMLGSMHLIFGQAVPSVVINAAYMPDIEVK